MAVRPERRLRRRAPRYGDAPAGQDAAFTFEPLLTAAAGERDVQELDRHPSLEASVAALAQPDGAHSALTDRGDQRVWADRPFRQHRLNRQRDRGLLEETFLRQQAVLIQELLQQISQVRIPFV